MPDLIEKNSFSYQDTPNGEDRVLLAETWRTNKSSGLRLLMEYYTIEVNSETEKLEDIIFSQRIEFATWEGVINFERYHLRDRTYQILTGQQV